MYIMQSVWYVDQYYSSLMIALALDGIIIIPIYHFKEVPFQVSFHQAGMAYNFKLDWSVRTI